MEIGYKDKGNYFRGLLILIGKDNIINKQERNSILSIGEKLGFENKFCNDAVENFLENPYIDTDPPIFSSYSIAKKFLEDAINLSLVDNDVHTEELEWLQNVAEKNSISSEWLDKKIKSSLLDYSNDGITEVKSEINLT